jgi:ATF/CREB family transcription factor
MRLLAALKCRQRKKAWLAQLQAKVEFLENENERLTSALVTSREEISRLSAIVGASGVSSTVGLSSVPGGAGTGVPSAGGQNGAAPISVNVSLPGPVPTKTVAAPVGGGRGYGY